MNFLLILSTIYSLIGASPVKRAAPTVAIQYPQATIVGLSGDVEQFPGIPFAQPPVGPFRLKPPQPITQPMGTVMATQNGKACPQFIFSDTINDAIPTSELGILLDTPLFQKALNEGEDCLVLNIHRPAGTTADSKLPVLFWIFGGGFEIGWNSMYDGAPWVTSSVSQGQPLIMVTTNYRVGGFGFLPGKEVMADGSANLGLRDQRLALQWVADNIAAFGGDPTKVTIWGESAGAIRSSFSHEGRSPSLGAISVFDQMVLYGGDNTYKVSPEMRQKNLVCSSQPGTTTVPRRNDELRQCNSSRPSRRHQRPGSLRYCRRGWRLLVRL
jgi:Carboxylesterase family